MTADPMAEYGIRYHGPDGIERIGPCTSAGGAAFAAGALRGLGSRRYQGARALSRTPGQPWRTWPAGRSWWITWLGRRHG